MTPARRLAALSFLSILLVQAIGRDVLAAAEVCESHGLRYNCITEELRVERISPMYDNGFEGTQDPANVTRPFQTWPSNWTPTGVPLRDGVKLSPFHEQTIRLFAAFNGTAQANVSDLPYYTDVTSLRETGLPSVRALSYIVRFNATLIMSGASEWYFRSPLKWDSDQFDRHYLDIRDSTGRLVVSDRYDPFAEPGNVTNAMLYEGRVYYHLIARLDSLQDYTIVEYVHPRDGTGLDHLDVHIAAHQDIDGNGDTSFKVFPSEQAQRNFDADGDLGYAFRFVFGQGPGGTMNLLQPNPAQNESMVEIRSGAFPTRNSSAGNDRYRLVIPLRTTFPLNGSVVLVVCPDYGNYIGHAHSQSCGSGVSYSARKDFTGVTGTFIEDFGDQSTVVSPPVPTGTQHYAKVVLTITNFQSRIVDGVEQNLISYPMYTTPLPDGTVSNHILTHYKNDAETEEDIFLVQPVEWTPWIEVIEDYVPSLPAVNPPQQSSTDILALFNPVEWMKLGVAAFVLAVVFPQISIPLYVIGVTSYAIAGSIVLVDYLSDPNVQANIADFAKGAFNALSGVLLGTVCAGAVLAPAIGAVAGGAIKRTPKGVFIGGRIGSAVQPLAAAGCAALALTEAGLLDDLLKLIIEIPLILQKAVEITGQLISSAIQIFVTAYDVLLPWILLFLYAMGMTLTIWLTRETALVVFAWLVLLFMAMKSQPAVDVLRRGEMFARMLPCPIWDNRMKKWGTLRGTYYRDEVYGRGKGV